MLVQPVTLTVPYHKVFIWTSGLLNKVKYDSPKQSGSDSDIGIITNASVKNVIQFIPEESTNEMNGNAKLTYPQLRSRLDDHNIVNFEASINGKKLIDYMVRNYVDYVKESQDPPSNLEVWFSGKFDKQTNRVTDFSPGRIRHHQEKLDSIRGGIDEQ